jgi:hypothetical protein
MNNRENMIAELLPLLAEHGIPKSASDKWLKLAHSLAQDSPAPRGLKKSRGPGRKAKWTPDHEIELVKAIRNEIFYDELTVTDACKKISTREPWISLVKPIGIDRTVADVLRERYQKLMMDCIDIFEDTKTGELFEKQRERRKVRRSGKHGQ